MNYIYKISYLSFLLSVFAIFVSCAMDAITIGFEKSSMITPFYEKYPKHFKYDQDNYFLTIVEPISLNTGGILDISFIINLISRFTYNSGFTEGKKAGLLERKPQGQKEAKKQFNLIQRNPLTFVLSALGFGVGLGAGTVGFAWWLKTRH